MYYGKGNYESFATPTKPEGIENQKAYIVGTGLGGLAAACFLVRDAQMPGKNITLFERLPLAGGSCDGWFDPTKGYIMRGGREMDDHFECMYDLWRSIPSLVNPGKTLLQELYEVNKADVNYSNCRVTEKCGQDAHTDKKYALSPKGALQVMKLMMLPERALDDVTIDEFFDDNMYNSNFWTYFQTMFAFEKWHSVAEMRRYLWRYIHHIDGLPDLSALRFTRYNQYTNWIQPMLDYLDKAGAKVIYGAKVTDVQLDTSYAAAKKVTSLTYEVDGKEKTIKVGEKDLVFITNGSQGDGSAYGDNDTAPVVKVKNGEGASVELWKKMCAQDPKAMGNPDKFFAGIEQTSWESWTVETGNEQILNEIRRITKREPLSGKVVTGGIVTCRDSSWLISWTINRQGQFPDQPEDKVLVWIYGLNCWHDDGDYIKKPMCDCTGSELAAEWLYHIGIPTSDIDRLAKEECRTTPCMMPYVTTFFMPRAAGDRPNVVPDGYVNLAFNGQFCESPRDTVFTTEYSIRTAMEGVYTLCNLDRAVPECWGSPYDVREVLRASSFLMDGQKAMEYLSPKASKVLGTACKGIGKVVSIPVGMVKKVLPAKQKKVKGNVFKENVLTDLLKFYNIT